jgi:hypothetical protein
MMAVFIAKWNTSDHFANKFSFIEKLIHCIENTNVPYNVQEWDTEKGGALEHKKRMEYNLKEIVAVIWIKTFFNILLHLPIFHLGN